MFLDRHHAWRSLDPTLDIWSNFMREKAFNLPFSFVYSKKDPTFSKDSTFYLASYPLSYSPSNSPTFQWSTQWCTRWSTQLSGAFLIDSPSGLVHFFLLFFPFWLSSTISQLMAICSANEIQTFKIWIVFGHIDEKH